MSGKTVHRRAHSTRARVVHRSQPWQERPPLYDDFDTCDPEPLIKTKVHIPLSGPGLLERERLLVRLAQGTQLPLTLVVAPAGYGKTALLSTWARRSSTPVAWVTLEKGDAPPRRFWSYVIAALDAAQPGVGAPAQRAARRAASLDLVLATLVNTPVSVQPLVLVLDNYHVIDDTRTHESLAFLIDHLPDALHLVIAGRAEIPLPLAQRRAANTLAELGADELRFTLKEVAALLREQLHTDVPDDVISTLSERTEGWAAGLRFATRGALRSANVPQALRAWSGSHRDMQEYFEQEVFAHISPDTRAFMLQTCVLDRLSAPLCAALQGSSNPPHVAPGTNIHYDDAEPSHGLIHVTQELLLSMERTGLFLLPLDEERRWYRYHTLFAEALRDRLSDESPELASVLRKRASALAGSTQAHRHCPDGLSRMPAAPWQQDDPFALEFSERELDVLRLLAAGYANQAIARELTVSVNTIKMHLRHLYEKLDVHNRVQATQRAHGLGILERAPRTAEDVR